ncbi:hypothetical protein HALLA_17240 [Halostagnicola larsenii XH-48]|uniref:Small CPxCG-related zinc finger protein n=1 Tax=Halostagnicola larsenii XH-48 TaxID=797299 RepID=W0JNY0_9EURY|nr:DUF6276 family protein [Halostagnicola larsenii]AHG00284.1 hypothetical protein HALLA_17240 [Halostagnicola larsenii XH-48]
MYCSHCDSPLVPFEVPEAYGEYAPSEAPVATICSRCLRVTDLEESNEVAVADSPDFTIVSEAFPTREKPAAGVALALGLCASLARNRNNLEALVADLERAGTDPLLTLERVCQDPSVEPTMDLERRLHQLEQFVY